MKKYLCRIVLFCFLAFLAGQLTESIGAVTPESVLTGWAALKVTGFIGVLVWLGYCAGREAIETKHHLN